MKILLLSDIHLEFGSRQFEIPPCDCIILAGDIHIGSRAVPWIEQNLPQIPILYVLGNHEYYKHSYPKQLKRLKAETENTNIKILENDKVVVDNIVFFGCTLWTDFDLYGTPEKSGAECQLRMNDYRLIRRDPGYSRITFASTMNLHQRSARWLEQSLTASDTSCNVVITHHAPSIQSIPEPFLNDPISAAYASNLDSLILETQPKLWVHGHVHSACDYMLGTTRVVSNPAGYPDQTNQGFRNPLIIEM